MNGMNGKVGTNFCGPPAVVHVPSKCGKFHHEDHLGTRDFHSLVAKVEKGSDDMAVRNLVKEIVGCLEDVHAYLINKCPITNL